MSILAVDKADCPDVSYPSDDFDYQRTFSLVQRTHYQIWQKLYQYPVSAVQEPFPLKRPSQTITQTKEAPMNQAQRSQ